MDTQDIVLHGFARDRVERRERLVHQQDVGIDGERYALALSAGQFVRITRAIAGEANQFQSFLCSPLLRLPCSSPKQALSITVRHGNRRGSENGHESPMVGECMGRECIDWTVVGKEKGFAK